jgi:hypothetical protein
VVETYDAQRRLGVAHGENMEDQEQGAHSQLIASDQVDVTRNRLDRDGPDVMLTRSRQPDTILPPGIIEARQIPWYWIAQNLPGMGLHPDRQAGCVSYERGCEFFVDREGGDGPGIGRR